MTKNEKTLTALLAVAIIILLLLYLNSRRVTRVNDSIITTPEIQPANITIWQSEIPGLTIDFGNWLPTLNEIYYANGSCMCQG